jgi:hypothetical protein
MTWWLRVSAVVNGSIIFGLLVTIVGMLTNDDQAIVSVASTPHQRRVRTVVALALILSALPYAACGYWKGAGR